MKEIHLEKFGSDDFDDYLKLYSHPDVMAMITERALSVEEAMQKYQKVLARNQKFKQFGTFKVYAGLKKFIGLGSLILNEEVPSEAEIGYMLLPEYWGKGYGGQIASKLINAANHAGLHKLTAIIDPNNTASKKILLKNGFCTVKICEMDGLPGEILEKQLSQ